MSLTIRAAGPLDRHALEALCADLLREHRDRYGPLYPAFAPDLAAAAYAAEWYDRLRHGDPKCLVWLATDRAPVGFLAAEECLRSVGEPARYCFAEWLYVRPDDRHQGIALALIGRMVAACRERGLTHVECQTVAGDIQWQRRGWTPTAVRHMRPVDGLAADVDRAASDYPLAKDIP